MLIDTHSHVNFKAYKDDYKEVIKRTLDGNVRMINVGTQFDTSKRAVEIAEEYESGVYAAIGLHPIHVSKDFVKIKNDDEETEVLGKGEIFEREKYLELAKSEKVVAIGEIGLDYYYKPKTKAKLEDFKQKQKESFLAQADLARELDLPLIIHCRMAHQDLIQILNHQIGASYKKLKGVMHCFTGSVEEMKEYLNLGFYIGFNGIIFKLDLGEAIKNCPPERILIETDCPYLTPLPAEVPLTSGTKEGPKDHVRNEPIFVKYVAERIAELKGISFEKIAEVTTQNAKDLFKI